MFFLKIKLDLVLKNLCKKRFFLNIFFELSLNLFGGYYKIQSLVLIENLSVFQFDIFLYFENKWLFIIE